MGACGNGAGDGGGGGVSGGSGSGNGSGSGTPYDFVMHADDDSFVRLDLLLPLMVGWGGTWDGAGTGWGGARVHPWLRQMHAAQPGVWCFCRIMVR